jgi:TetR/AcrR family transcriptional regulator
MPANAVPKNGNRKSAVRRHNEAAILKAAERVFAESGYRGATTSLIAERAGIPKPNLHYYYPTKESLYRRVVENIFNFWLQTASAFDDCDDPEEALTRYIGAKMDISRSHPDGSKVWANEILHGAPVMQSHLETTLKRWTDDRVAVIERWIKEGRMRPIDARCLLYMIWSCTRHYADFDHQITTLNHGKPLSDEQFEQAKSQVVDIILNGVGIARRSVTR